MQRKWGSAFTLIELLIVVAIIAILASIAIPNMVRARIRAQVSRASSDIRTLATALEAYQVDWNRLPLYTAASRRLDRMPRGMVVLTTPIAYMGSHFDTFVDPFGWFNLQRNQQEDVFYEAFYGSRIGPQNNARVVASVRDAYIIESIGPDTLDSIDTGRWGWDDNQGRRFIPYDPSNGTISFGDIYRTGGRLPEWFVASGWPRIIPTGN